MSIIANTFLKYDAKGVREDLSNIITMISPETRPFMSNMTKSRSVTNTFFEWQTDDLGAAAANHHLEGDDLASFTAVTPTTRLGNFTQISRRDFIVSDTMSALDLAGRRAEVAYQISLAGKRLANDMEHNLCGLNHAAVAGNSTTARKTAPLAAFIKTNTSRGTGGANPTVSGGVVNAAATDGTQRSMSEGMLKTVLQGIFSNGGNPEFVMVGPHVKTVISVASAALLLSVIWHLLTALPQLLGRLTCISPTSDLYRLFPQPRAELATLTSSTQICAKWQRFAQFRPKS